MIKSDSTALKRIKEILWVMSFAALVAVVGRFAFGLGAASYMSDGLPWGMWKIFNMVAGAALATSGFVVAFIINIWYADKYRSIGRIAVLIGFLGYGASLTALVFDIGLPWRGWHPFLIWNPHSFLFEVFWCVSVYWMITAYEMVPVILERFPFPRLTHFLHEMALPIIALGVTLSTMHHSSLGSLFMLSYTRLHPLWHTFWIPIEFFISAMGAGMATIVLIMLIVSWLYRRKPDLEVLSGVARISAVLLAIFLAIRLIVLTAEGKWNWVFGSDAGWEGKLFLIEITLQAIIPVIIGLSGKWRKTVPGLYAFSVPAFIGLVMHRLDVGFVGYFRFAERVYVPSLAEMVVCLGVPAAAALLFFFLLERFYILEAPEACHVPEAEGVHHDMAPQFTLREAFSMIKFKDGLKVSLIVVITIPLAYLAFLGKGTSKFEPTPQPVEKAKGVDETRAVLKIDGNLSAEYVNFPHDVHQELMGGEDSCVKCHHLERPDDHATSCHLCHADMAVDTDIFDHDKHKERMGNNDSCDKCHESYKEKSEATAKGCVECHDKDGQYPMTAEKLYGKGVTRWAPGYKHAMHGLCLTCHRMNGDAMGCNAEADCIGNCAFCHEPKVTNTTAMK